MEKASESARTRAREHEFIISALVRARAPAVRTPRDCARYWWTQSHGSVCRTSISHARLMPGCRGAVWPNYRGLALSA